MVNTTHQSSAGNPSRALIVEPNPYHGEILPGFVKYFQDLGYTVTVLCNPGAIAEDPFCRVPEESRPQILTKSPQDIATYLQSPPLQSEYDVVFFSTNVYWEENINETSWLEFAGGFPRHDTVLFVEHNLSYQEVDSSGVLAKSGQLVVLHQRDDLTPGTVAINPHYFGTVAEPATLSHDELRIAIVGSPSFTAGNIDLLFSALRQAITLEGPALNVSLVGFDAELPPDLVDFVSCTGRLDFDNLYSLIEHQHVLCTLIDKEVEFHQKYLQGSTTGSLQLSYGFTKPLLLSECAVKAYHLDSYPGCLPFEHSPRGLSEVITSLLKMSAEEYQTLIEHIETTQQRVADASRSALASLIQTVSGQPLQTAELIRDGSMELVRVNQYWRAEVNDYQQQNRDLAAKYEAACRAETRAENAMRQAKESLAAVTAERDAARQELQNVYNSARWKAASRALRVFGR